MHPKSRHTRCSPFTRLLMPVNLTSYNQLQLQLQAAHVQLVAVSKIKPVTDIMALYNAGQRDFGENYVQELADKQPKLPNDVRWHFIGHLQSNKVKYIAPFVHLIHGVDSLKLLKEINKQAAKAGRIISCLLQVHIAEEETKFGFNEEELTAAVAEIQTAGAYEHIKVEGLMGMASFSDDLAKVRREMQFLKKLFDQFKAIQSPQLNLSILSMGMSGDYALAIEEGSNMVRIGSLLFGARL
jgi:pyridoxal phosphate enzyme (YggS family)